MRTACLALLALTLAAAAAAADAPPPVTGECGSAFAGLPARTAWLRTADGERLYTAELGSGPVGVVLAHELGANLCNWLSFGDVLRKRGFHVLLVDLRGFGLSARPRQPWRLDRDLAAASAELRGHGARQVFLVGGSLGGTAVLVAATRIRPRVAGVVDVSGGGDLGEFLGGPTHGAYDVQVVAPRLHAPLLVVAARLDPAIDVPYYRRLLRRVGTGDRALVLYPGGAHASSLVDADPAARARIVAFLRSHS